MITYDPSNHYWLVGADTTRVWSSLEKAYVSIADAAYMAWTGAGNPTSRIDSEQAICALVNRDVVEKINALEAKQARALREILLDVDVSANQARLSDLDADISALRVTLLSEPLS